MARYYVRRWLGYPSPAVVGLALVSIGVQLAAAGLEPLSSGEQTCIASLGGVVPAGAPPLLVRLLPALAGAALVFLVAAMVRRLEGSRFAQALAALAVVVAPGYLAAHHRLGPAAFAPALWAVGALVLLDVCGMRRRGGWIALGVIGGASAWLVPATVWLVAGLGATLVVTRERRWLLTAWPWAGLVVALLVAALPLWWQSQQGWPAWAALAGADAGGPGRFALAQVTAMHPLGVPVWLGGLAWLLFGTLTTPYRALAWPFLVPAGLLAALGAAPAALAPAFPALFAAGGLAVDRWISKRGRPWMRAPALAALALGGLATAPLALPVLPVDAATAYREAWARVLPLALDDASRSASSVSTEGRK